MRHQLALALLLASTACVDNTPSASDVTSDLERSNGGRTAVDLLDVVDVDTPSVADNLTAI